MSLRLARHRAPFAVTAVLLAAACAEPGTVPTTSSRVALGGRSDARLTPAGSTRIPNSVKYSDRGVKPARGKSSKGQDVWSRALLNADGTVTLEIATAELESGAPTVGQIDKVQVKSVLPSGKKSVLNVNDVPGNSGYVALAIGARTRGTVLDVQANVDDAKGKRTDVVVTQPAVAYRPDLRVLPLDLLPRVGVGIPFDVAATVRETNGDVGARADCVLLVDGTQADRVTGMWVDAAGSVTCLFRAPAIATPGTHAIAVRVERVAPGDYDLANDVATGSIAVVLSTPGPVDPGDPVEHVALDYDVKITQRVGHSKSMQTTFYNGTDGSHADTHFDVDADHREQTATFMTWTRRALRPAATAVNNVAPVLASLALTETSDGSELQRFSLASIPLTLNYGTVAGFGGGCYLSGPYSSGFSLSLCTAWNAVGIGETFVQYTRFATEVQYLSRGYQNAYDAQNTRSSTAAEPSYTTSTSGTTFVAYGSSATYDFLVNAGTFTFGSHPTVALVSAPYNADTPKICSNPSTTVGGAEYVCNQFFDSGVETTGSVSTGDPNAQP